MVHVPAAAPAAAPPSGEGASHKAAAGQGTAAAAWDINIKPVKGWAMDEAGTPTTGSSTASSPAPPSTMSSEDELETEQQRLVTPRPPLLAMALGGQLNQLKREASDEMETEAAASILSSVLPDMARLSNSLASAAGAPPAAPQAARAAAAARGYEDLLTTLASLASGCRPLDPLHERLSQVSMDDSHLGLGLGTRSASASAAASLLAARHSHNGRPDRRRRAREEEQGHGSSGGSGSGSENDDEDEEEEDDNSVGSGGSWGGASAARRRHARMEGPAGGGRGVVGRARSVSMPEGCDAWNRYAAAGPVSAAAHAHATVTTTSAGHSYGYGHGVGGSAAALASAAAAAAAAVAAAAEEADGCVNNPILPHMLARYSDVYNKHGRIGIYTREERAAIIHRFLQKRARRVWAKKVRYACRKNLADKRIRVKGRFIKLDPSATAAASERLEVIEEGKALAAAAEAEAEGEADGEEEEEGESGSEEREQEQEQPVRRMRRHSICF